MSNTARESNWQAIVAELTEAQQGWEQASSEEDTARKRSTAMLNRLNAAQKQFDLALAELKKNAPRDSDWKRSEMLSQK